MEKYSRILSTPSFNPTTALRIAKPKREPKVEAKTEALPVPVEVQPEPIKPDSVHLVQSEDAVTYPRVIEGAELQQYIQRELKKGNAYAEAEYDAGRHPKFSTKRPHHISCLVAEPDNYTLIEESKGIYLLERNF